MYGAAKLPYPRVNGRKEHAEQLEGELYATWSPEQIVERFRIEHRPTVCFKTIYRWIYAGRLTNGALYVLADPFPSVRKTFILGKHLGIGNWIRRFQVVGKLYSDLH